MGTARRLLVQVCKELLLSCLPSGKPGGVGLTPPTPGTRAAKTVLNYFKSFSWCFLCSCYIAWSFLLWEESLSSSSLLLKIIRILYIWIDSHLFSKEPYGLCWLLSSSFSHVRKIRFRAFTSFFKEAAWGFKLRYFFQIWGSIYFIT